MRLFKLHSQLNTLRIPYCSVQRSLSKSAKETSTPNIPTKSFYTPALSDNEIKRIDSVLGLNIGLTFVGWARIKLEEHQLTHLDYIMFPENYSKMDLNNIYVLASKIVDSIPEADKYVIETVTKSFTGASGRLQLSLQASRFLMVASIVTLLNNKHKNDSESCAVIFLKEQLAGRLFNLLMGNEMTSCKNTVTELLENENSMLFVKPSLDVITTYNTAHDVGKEIMGRAILESSTFIQLVVNKNAESFKNLKRYSHFVKINPA